VVLPRGAITLGEVRHGHSISYISRVCLCAAPRFTAFTSCYWQGIWTRVLGFSLHCEIPSLG